MYSQHSYKEPKTNQDTFGYRSSNDGQMRLEQLRQLAVLGKIKDSDAAAGYVFYNLNSDSGYFSSLDKRWSRFKSSLGKELSNPPNYP